MTEDKKRRILFVDDEQDLLDGIRRVLRKERHRWELVFACGAEAALQELEKAPLDVIVSDMRMPGMDGAALLRIVRNKYPNVTRMVLTGKADETQTIRAIPVTHQWLSKPCSPEELTDALERACAMHGLLEDPALIRIVNRISSLPSFPRAYADFIGALENPDVSLDEVAALLGRDPGMCAKVLQMTNSAFFALPRVIVNVREAVGLLGLRTIGQLVLCQGVFETLTVADGIDGLSFEKLQEHASLTSRIASRILEGKAIARDGMAAAAMLHDAGLLILAKSARDQLQQAVRQARSTGCALWQAEKEILGITHAQVGAALLSVWGLPMNVVETIAYHHEPRNHPDPTSKSLLAVHVASSLASETELHENPESALQERVDTEYLQSIDMADKLPGWRSIAQEEAQEQQALLA